MSEPEDTIQDHITDQLITHMALTDLWRSLPILGDQFMTCVHLAAHGSGYKPTIQVRLTEFSDDIPVAVLGDITAEVRAAVGATDFRLVYCEPDGQLRKPYDGQEGGDDD